MTDEKLVAALNDGRLVHAAEHLIYPLIDTMIQNRILQAVGKFQDGKTDFVADVAYIAGMKEIEHTLKDIQKKGNRAYEQIEKNKN